MRKIPTIIAIDPASNKAGVALYYNEIIRSALLTGYGNWTQRITQQRQQLELFLNHYFFTYPEIFCYMLKVSFAW